MDRAPDSSAAPRSAELPHTASLEHAGPITAASAGRFDLAVLVIALLQASLAIYISGSYLIELVNHGHEEVQNVGLVEHVAWIAFQPAIQGTVWAALSLVVVFGATCPPGGWRRRLYLTYATGAVLSVLGFLLALNILQEASFSYRWVYTGSGIAQPQSWRLFVFETSWYWQFPLMFLILNPAFIALTVRTARQKLGL